MIIRIAPPFRLSRCCKNLDSQSAQTRPCVSIFVRFSKVRDPLRASTSVSRPLRTIIIKIKKMCQEKNLDTSFFMLYDSQGDEMERFVERSFLFDFYGELLTDHQQNVYKQVVFEDYSVSEVAREAGISRQGVHDMVRRCDKLLEEYEAKLHLVERFLALRGQTMEIQKLAAADNTDPYPGRMESIREIASRIIEEL